MNNCLSDEEHSQLGSYEIGLMKLLVNTEDDLQDLNKLRDPDFSADWLPTFFHEYVHFLQDVSTTQGLLNFILQIEELRNVSKVIRDSNDLTFHVPLIINNEYNFPTNIELLSIYKGVSSGQNIQYELRSAAYESYSFEMIDITTANQDKLHIPKYTVKYLDTGAQSYVKCHFGSRHIKEYMAHALQTQFATDTHHEDIPYKLAEQILEKEAPMLAKDVSLMVAFCDACLMNFHPAELFFKSIERLKLIPNIEFNDVQSVYDFIQTGWENCEPKQFGKTVNDVYGYFCNEAINRFNDSLKGVIFERNRTWFTEIIENAKNLRFNQQGFITQLVESPSKLSLKFFEVLALVGTPYVTNSKGKGYFIPPITISCLAIEPEFLKVFQAVRRTFQGHKQCSMHKHCSAEPSTDITNELCITTPWERVNDTNLCPYAQLWKTWDFAGKTPTTSPIE